MPGIVILVHVNGCRRQTCYVNCIYRGEEFYSAIDFVREYKMVTGADPAHKTLAMTDRAAVIMRFSEDPHVSFADIV